MKIKLPKIKSPKIHWPKVKAPKLKKKQLRTLKFVGLALIILFPSIVILGTIFPGGWETTAKIAPNGSVMVQPGTATPKTFTYTNNPGPYFGQYEVILSWANAFGLGSLPMTQVKVSISAPVHMVYNPQGELIQTLNEHDHIKDYWADYAGGVRQYFEHHLYVVSITIRTLSGSSMPMQLPISVWATFEFDITPWELVPPAANQTYTAPDGSELYYVDGWAGIMSAWVARNPEPEIGPVDGSPWPDDYGGFVRGSDPKGHPEDMQYVSDSSAYQGYAFESVGLARVPQQVLITVFGGTLMQGGKYILYPFTPIIKTIQSVDYRYHAWIVIDVLQRRGFTLKTGDLPDSADDVDEVGDIHSWWDSVVYGWNNFWTSVATGIQSFFHGVFDFALGGLGQIVIIVVVALLLYVSIKEVPNLVRRKGRKSKHIWTPITNKVRGAGRSVKRAGSKVRRKLRLRRAAS